MYISIYTTSNETEYKGYLMMLIMCIIFGAVHIIIIRGRGLLDTIIPTIINSGSL